MFTLVLFIALILTGSYPQHALELKASQSFQMRGSRNLRVDWTKVCFDFSGFETIENKKCGWFGEYVMPHLPDPDQGQEIPKTCTEFGDELGTFDSSVEGEYTSVNEACCVCGGGNLSSPAPSPSSSSSSSTSSSDSFSSSTSQSNNSTSHLTDDESNYERDSDLLPTVSVANSPVSSPTIISSSSPFTSSRSDITSTPAVSDTGNEIIVSVKTAESPGLISIHFNPIVLGATIFTLTTVVL